MGQEHIEIGMDDIDSPTGGCTTHFASLLVSELEQHVSEWLDYPNLVRLNPNIPYRTRGNGAVALRFMIDSEYVDDLIPNIRNLVADYANTSYTNTNPGIVLIRSTPDECIRSFSQRALWRTLPVALARRLISKLDLVYSASGNGRGLIGALAALGNELKGDYTYEYIAYRSLTDCKRPRNVDKASVLEMDKIMGDRTFSNIDLSSDTILIEPQGPDPVLYGIRGERPHDLIEAASYVESGQTVTRWMIFRTNQGTDEHLSHMLKIAELRPYMSAKVSCKVIQRPHIIEGGHVILRVADETGSIDCAAYEPTGDFRWVIDKLIENDRLILHAGVRPASRSHGLTLNIEGVKIQNLAKEVQLHNPPCPECGRTLKSAGKDKGFKCFNCGYKSSEMEKLQLEIKREITKGMYLPRPGAQRHLTRPLVRTFRKNQLPVIEIDQWHMP